MRPKSLKGNGFGHILIGFLACTPLCLQAGDPVFPSGSATYSLDPDLSRAGGEISFTKNPLSLPVGAFDFDQTIMDMDSAVQGKGSVFHTENPSVFGVSFPANTGVSQFNNGEFSGAAQLKLDFTASWTIENSPFGPTVVGFANFPSITGTVDGSPGSFIRYELSANFSGAASRSPVAFDTGPITTAGQFITSFFNSEELTPNSLKVGDQETISGTLTFTAFSAGNGSSQINLGQGSNFQPVPEPAAYALAVGLGLMGFAGYRAYWIQRLECL